MTKFRLNISKINEHCESIEHSLKSYDELSDKIYGNVKSSHNIWIDPASIGFNQIVCKDEKTLKDIKISLQQYNNNLINFSRELGNIFTSSGYSLTNMSIYYDSSYVDICIDNLNNISSLLKNTLQEFSSCIVPDDFEYLSKINDVYNATFNCRNRLLEIDEDIISIRKSIDILMNDAIKKNRDIELITCDDKVTRFNWSITPLVRKNNPTLVKENKYRINADNLTSKSHEASLNRVNDPIKVSSSTTTTLVEQTPIEKSDTSTISYNNPETSIEQLEHYIANNKYNVKSKINESSIDNKELSETDNASLNIDKGSHNNIDFNLLEDDKHNIESEVKKTDFNVMNLANEEDVKLDLSASATQVN